MEMAMDVKKKRQLFVGIKNFKQEFDIIELIGEG